LFRVTEDIEYVQAHLQRAKGWYSNAHLALVNACTDVEYEYFMKTCGKNELKVVIQKEKKQDV